MASLAYIQICRTCNQNCKFCSNPSSGNVIPLSEAKQLVDHYIAEGYGGLILSGGEPTLYEELPALVAYSTEKKFPVRIITNGQKTADKQYVKTLVAAGLNHWHLSVYSDDVKVQAFLTENEDSLKNVKKTLYHLAEFGAQVDINTVINKYNADHLSRIVKWIVRDYPYIGHFVWNNLDPVMNRTQENLDTIARLSDFELELFKAMFFLSQNNKTFRVERVPLCYMAEYAYCATETRKNVKGEERAIYFLDEKGLKLQKGWAYGKADCCQICFLNEVCAGLYLMDEFYDSQELYPVFISKEWVMKKVLMDN